MDVEAFNVKYQLNLNEYLWQNRVFQLQELSQYLVYFALNRLQKNKYYSLPFCHDAAQNIEDVQILVVTITFVYDKMDFSFYYM